MTRKIRHGRGILRIPIRGTGEPPVPSVCLVILDGWGLAEPGPGNAVELADTPVFDELWSTYDHAQLTAWARAVGLPDGQMGNSEVGHLNLGAGAVVPQDLTRIDDAVEDGSFFENEVLREACAAARDVRPAAPAGAGVGGRGAREHGPPACLHRAGGARAGARRGAARVHRRPRHPARLRGRIRGRGGVVAGRARRPRGQRDRPLLRDGPRPAARSAPARRWMRSSEGRPRTATPTAARRP